MVNSIVKFFLYTAYASCTINLLTLNVLDEVSMARKYKKKNTVNKHAEISYRWMRNGKICTETVRRDSGLEARVTTDPRNNSTRFFVDFGGLRLNVGGREARTLFRVLARHYQNTDKSLEPAKRSYRR